MGWKHNDPPLGVGYIAAFLREHEIDCSIIDTTFDFSFSTFETILKKQTPDVVGFSTPTFFANNAFRLAQITRSLMKNCKIVFGGPHATVSPKETLMNDCVDYVVIGEGEQTMLELIQTIAAGKEISNVNGIGYKQDGDMHLTEARKFIEDMDSIPFPARDLLPMEKYLAEIPAFPLPFPATSMMASRGCPGNCAYCQPTLRKLFGNRVRQRSVSNVLDEVEYLIKEYKIKAIDFQDDTMARDRDWILNFSEGVQERGIDIKWRCQNRVDCLDKETAPAMRKAGCINMVFGVESGDQRILSKVLNKGIKVEDTERAFKLCQKFGISTRANFMIGNPTEDKEALSRSIDLLKRIKPDIVLVHNTCPFPGTRLWDRVIKDGTLNIGGLDNFYRHTPYPIKLENLTEEDIKETKSKMLREFRKTALFYPFYKLNYDLIIFKRWASLFRSPITPKRFVSNFLDDLSTIGLPDMKPAAVRIFNLFSKNNHPQTK